MNNDVNTLDFADVVRGLKDGHFFLRLGWNGKGMFIYLAEPGDVRIHDDHPLSKTCGMDLVHCGDYIEMKTVDGEIAPWVASQSDILADDWIQVNPQFVE